MTSNSVQDNSSIIVEFNTDVEVKSALQDVKDAVDKAKSDLPNDLDIDPMVMDIDFSEFPILNINLSGDYSLDDLKVYAEELQPIGSARISNTTTTTISKAYLKKKPKSW